VCYILRIFDLIWFVLVCFCSKLRALPPGANQTRRKPTADWPKQRWPSGFWAEAPARVVLRRRRRQRKRERREWEDLRWQRLRSKDETGMWDAAKSGKCVCRRNAEKCATLCVAPHPYYTYPPLILATAPLFHLPPTTLKHPLREQRDMSTKTEKRR